MTPSEFPEKSAGCLNMQPELSRLFLIMTGAYSGSESKLTLLASGYNLLLGEGHDDVPFSDTLILISYYINLHSYVFIIPFHVISDGDESPLIMML